MPKDYLNNQPNFLEEDEVSRDFSMYDDDEEYEEYNEETTQEQPVEERDFEEELSSQKQKKSSFLINIFNARIGRPTEYTDIDYKLRTSRKGQALFMIVTALFLLGLFALFIIFR